MRDGRRRKTSLVHLPKVSAEITPGLTGFTVGVLEGSADQANRNCQRSCTHSLREGLVSGLDLRSDVRDLNLQSFICQVPLEVKTSR